MGLEHLTFVDGIPFEEIKARLEKAKIRHTIYENKDQGYFRCHRIHLFTEYRDPQTEKMSTRIIALLGFPHNYKGTTYSYYALYSLSPDFDFAVLDRRVTFNHGRLVENTLIVV